MKWFTVIVLPCLVGCAQMRVQVDIFNKDYALATSFVAADVQKAEVKAKGLLDGRLDSTYASLTTKLESQADALFTKNLVAKEEIDQLKSDLRGPLKDYFDKARTAYAEGVALAEKARLDPTWFPGKEDSPQRRETYMKAAARLSDGDRNLAEAKRFVATNFVASLQAPLEVAKIQAKAKPADPVAADAVKTAEAAVKASNDASEEIGGLIGSHGIFSDPNASLVVNSPPGAWTGVFNRTYGLGILGNTDIAVKMEDIANFSLKGVRNDATKVTQATFNSVNLLVKTFAAFEGVPIAGGTGTGTTSDTSTAGTTAATGTSGSGQAASDQDVLHRRRREAARAILDAIGREATVIDVATDTQADKTARQTAVQRIKSVVDANKSELTAN